jgi:hypothetical protein
MFKDHFYGSSVLIAKTYHKSSKFMIRSFVFSVIQYLKLKNQYLKGEFFGLLTQSPILID